jgi:hypothetical protein
MPCGRGGNCRYAANERLVAAFGSVVVEPDNGRFVGQCAVEFPTVGLGPVGLGAGDPPYPKALGEGAGSVADPVVVNILRAVRQLLGETPGRCGLASRSLHFDDAASLHIGVRPGVRCGRDDRPSRQRCRVDNDQSQPSGF